MAVGSPTFLDSHVSSEIRAAHITVTSATSDAREDWDNFVASRAEGSFYHLYDWKRLNSTALGHESEYLSAYDAEGQIRGVLPLVSVRSPLFGNILCSMPFVNFGGPLSESEEATSRLISAACEIARIRRYDYLELRCRDSLPGSLDCSLRKISMTVQLDPDPETLWADFSSKHRTNIRRAQKNDLIVAAGGIALLDEFYKVLSQSWHDLGTPLYSKSYFEQILLHFPDKTRIFVCRHNGEPVATAFNGEFNGVVEGLWAGVRTQYRSLQPNYVLYWEMLRDACVRGFGKYHLGRSTSESGAEQFKSKWNAESQQLYWYFYRPDGGRTPALNVDNPKYRLAIAAWQRLPMWTTRLVGPHIARLIP